MLNARILLVVPFFISCPVATAANDPAQFWISTSNVSPIVPEAPVINLPVGQLQTLYLWARPATDQSNAYRKLYDFELDIKTLKPNPGNSTNPFIDETNPFIDFIDGTYKVYNDPFADGSKRFQFTSDSLKSDEQGGPLLSDRSATQVLSGTADAIKGLNGISIDMANIVGLGAADDPHRVNTTNGPAWLLAEFGVKALRDNGSNTLFLQIGPTGVLSQGTATTRILLGNNQTPIYDPTLASHRLHTLLGDTFDLQINAVPSLRGDYNHSGSIDGGDYVLWRSTFGQAVTAGSGADGSGNAKIDASDYIVWRNAATGSAQSTLFVASDAISRSSIVPEPGTKWLVSVMVAWVFLMRCQSANRTCV